MQAYRDPQRTVIVSSGVQWEQDWKSWGWLAFQYFFKSFWYLTIGKKTYGKDFRGRWYYVELHVVKCLTSLVWCGTIWSIL